MDPPREDGRRCLNADELEAAGLRRLTDEEMGARYPNRVGSGVPLYFDPKAAERIRRHSAEAAVPATSRSVDATRALGEGLARAA